MPRALPAKPRTSRVSVAIAIVVHFRMPAHGGIRDTDIVGYRCQRLRSFPLSARSVR